MIVGTLNGIRTSVFVGCLLLCAIFTAGGASAASDPGQLVSALAQEVPGIVSATASQAPTGTGTDLVFRVAIPGATPAGGEIATAMWKAALVAAAANSEYAAAGLAPVTGVDVRLVSPSGVETRLGGGIGKPPANTAFTAITPALLQAIQARCASLGLANATVTTVLGGSAIMIVAQSSDPNATMQSLSGVVDVLTELVGQDPSSFEGVYFELDDTLGTSVYVNGLATLAGTHSVYSNTNPSDINPVGAGYLGGPARLPDLTAAVGKAGRISLRYLGKPVSTLKPGRYVFTMIDPSKRVGFVLQKSKGRRIALTGAAFSGKHVSDVYLTAGRWTLLWGAATSSFAVSG